MDTDPTLHPEPQESPRGEDVPADGVDGVEVVPCTAEFDIDEEREYGGFSARYLAIFAISLLRRRIAEGFGEMLHHLCKEARPVEHAIYIYTRVKAAMRKLSEPISFEIRVTDKGTYVPRYPMPACDRLEETEPAISHAEWKAIDEKHGLDVRGTSMVWVERRVAKARSNARRAAKRAYVKQQNLTRAKPSQQMLARLARDLKQQNALNAAYAKRVKDNPELVYEPPVKIGPTYGEIYPPVPLPDRKLVPVTVTAVPAVPPMPTIDEVDPVVGVEQAYSEYAYRHSTYAVHKDIGWKIPVFIEPEKPP